MRVLAVDPGSRHIGIAISDTTGTIANPLKVLTHVSRIQDAQAVADIAQANNSDLIVIGRSLDDHGSPSYEGRRAERFAKALSTIVHIPVVFWDESFTTQEAREARIAMGASRKNRSGHLDAIAATILLQSYLDSLPRP